MTRIRNILFVMYAKKDSHLNLSLKDTGQSICKQTKDFICPSHSCGCTFKSKQSLKTHMELHSGEMYPCKEPGCPKTFASENYCHDHMNMQHGDPYQCKRVLNGCNFETCARTTLHQHEDFFVNINQKRTRSNMS